MGKRWDTPGALVERPPDRSVKWDQVAGNHNPSNQFDAARTLRSEGAKFRGWLSDRLAEALRVAKPGAHLLCWAIPRTSHWTGTAIEDAGWVIEDVITHIFGTGFPKHKSKLKPGAEHWILATKPGGAKWLNVDGCRIGTTVETWPSSRSYAPGQMQPGHNGKTEQTGPAPAGRWPANICLSHSPGCVEVGTRLVKTGMGFRNVTDEQSKRATFPVACNGEDRGYADPDGRETVAEWRCVENCPVRLLDEQAGERKSGGKSGTHYNCKAETNIYGGGLNEQTSPLYSDSGNASRFFYVAKASKADRGEGNKHPTCKNTNLMSWLARLVCPPGGTVFDPFMGSGSTGVASIREGFGFIGIEQEAEYFATAKRRLKAAQAKEPLFA